MWVLVALAVTAFAAKPTTVEEFLAQPVEKHVEQLTGQDFVDYINEHQSFYRAEYSPEAEAFVKSRIMDSRFLVEPRKEEVLSGVFTLPEPPERTSHVSKPIADSRLSGTRRAWPVAIAASPRQLALFATDLIGANPLVADSHLSASTLASSGQNADPLAPSVINRAVGNGSYPLLTQGTHLQKLKFSRFLLGSICSGSHVGSVMCAVEQYNKDVFFKVLISDTDILSCCGTDCGYGCEGGWPIEAFRWMGRDGVVTGGKYRQKDACRPYAFYPCGHHRDEPYYGPCPSSWPTPTCRKTCQLKYNISYEDDKYFARTPYYLPEDEKRIRQEIVMNGPLVATFKVYEDFSFYKSGIYVHKWGEQTGAHAVKVVGWGRENGTDYWLIANSWNTDWGEGGFFRIVRGTNNCEIEKDTVSARMKV
ncbi:hypothetical protein ANCCAN_00679 [Ancylostoma caninum]|uniref:Peptidase C1A papain C-terminal domain-containing protein n=1 Tax=Ancylostoma caninum TaxID=29170 RepID=A0A368H9A0_ANCCA|nr:hypothetical protein ANCCAN_00679 [Ancylostoma caninum]